MKELLFEFIGTFFLVLTIALSRDPLAIGIVLACLVYAGGAISGAHYNPAVSLALFLRKKLTQRQFQMYVTSQFSGAILATITSTYIFDTPLTVYPGAGIVWASALAAEVLFTFLLVTIILHVAASKKTQGNNFFGFAIGGTVFAGAKSVGSISGGAFNPAVGIAPLLVNFIIGAKPFDPSILFLYTIGPLCGAILAAIIHNYTQK